ncbi:uncharacterized protein [Prorops nasuta]|uniref:uncharacterized protein n=1 Tax=Prorops nasuta TaxID=863751 RepID=UPI0034CFE15B
MDGKRFRTADIFKKVEEKFNSSGIYNRSFQQLLDKFKTMKKQYMVSRFNCSKSGTGAAEKSGCLFYEELHELFGHRPTANHCGIDSTLSPTNSSESTSETSEIQVADEIFVSNATCTNKRKMCSFSTLLSESNDEEAVDDPRPITVDDSFQDCDSKRKKQVDKNRNLKKRENPKSGLRNVMSDFAEKIIQSQDKCIEKLILEQREMDKNIMTEFNNICSQQTNILLNGLQKLNNFSPLHVNSVNHSAIMNENSAFTLSSLSDLWSFGCGKMNSTLLNSFIQEYLNSSL